MNFQRRKLVQTSEYISIHTRRRALKCYIEPILMYGCLENFRTATKETGGKRNVENATWTVQKSNQTMLQAAEITSSLINRIGKSQATIVGHVMRRDKLEYLATTGMTKGKQREMMLDGPTEWLIVG